MIKINYFGHSYFLIEGNDYSIALDPFKNIGLKETSVSADYLFCSHEHYDHNNRALVNYKSEVTSGGVFKIITAFHDDKNGALRGLNNVLVFDLDGVRFCFLGDLGERLNKDIISVKDVDVLLCPIGSVYTIDTSGAMEYINAIKPKTVIPMHYKIKGSKIDIEDISNFKNKIVEYKETNSPYAYNKEDKCVIINL